MTHFFPKDELSKELLSTVRRKVHANIEQLRWAKSEGGNIGPLSWIFYSVEDDESVIKVSGYIRLADDHQDITIAWDKDTIYGTDKRFENLTSELDFFVELEKHIYTIIEDALNVQEADNAKPN